jgi:hypothetical protein
MSDHLFFEQLRSWPGKPNPIQLTKTTSGRQINLPGPKKICIKSERFSVSYPDYSWFQRNYFVANHEDGNPAQGWWISYNQS